jgi:tRNA pseudouridine-54 N-methylase
MTPRQRSDYDRLKQRNLFLEKWNRENAAVVRLLLLKSTKKPPKTGTRTLEWLADLPPGEVRLSKSDVKALRRLLAWTTRLNVQPVGKSEKQT